MRDESSQPGHRADDMHTGETGDIAASRDPLAPGAASDLPPVPHVRRIGAYSLTRVIASGGMGTVYLAKQEHPNRPVALKLMRPGLATDEAMHRFQREAELLGRMQHPNIAQVYESGTHKHDGTELPFFAMEYIPGAKPITTYARENNLSIQQRLELFATVCEAVHHGHQRGVIHRDLKPGNVLIDLSGRPKVIDFGVARAIDADRAATMQTSTGQLMGTLGYMSPEQFSGTTEWIDARSDVYALGVLLYELLCGKLPFDIDRTPLPEAMRIVREHDPVRPSSIHHTLRGDIETIILTALEKNPARRYQSADDLRQDVLRWMRGETILARAPTIPYLIATRCRRFVRRHPAMALLVVTLIVGTLGSAVGHALLYGPLGGRFHQTYIDVLGATMPAPAPLREFETVRIIRLTDHTFTRVPELAERLDMPEVTLSDLRSLRRLHGQLMKRLAEAGATTVIWDFRIIGETPHDEGFLQGVDALRDVDAGVVVVVNEWKGDPDLTEQHINPRVLSHPHVRRGTPKARFMNVGCELDLIGVQGRYEIPSLVLAGYASHHHSSGRIRYSLDHPLRRLAHVTCYVQDDPDRPHIERVEHHSAIPLSGIVEYASPTDGLMPGDLTGAMLITVPTEEVIEPARMEYADVFDHEIDELREIFAGRPVVIADYREGIDQYVHMGREIYGGDLIATGLEVLFQGSRWIIRSEWSLVSIPAIMLGALIGVSIAGATGGAMRRSVVLAVIAALLVVVACLIAYPLLRYILNPVAPAVVLVLAAVAGVAVLRLRQGVPA